MSFDYEQLLITNELGEIIRLQNQAIERLRTYRESYPYLIAPNLARMIEDNLKENVQMLYRELNNLHKPKTEQRRHVCRECHGVFAAALRGGLCDECRSKVESSSYNVYEVRTPTGVSTSNLPPAPVFDEPTDADDHIASETTDYEVYPDPDSQDDPGEITDTSDGGGTPRG